MINQFILFFIVDQNKLNIFLKLQKYLINTVWSDIRRA